MIGSFDEQEFAVAVLDPDDQIGNLACQLVQQGHDEPLVLDIVAKVRDSMEVAGKVWEVEEISFLTREE